MTPEEFRRHGHRVVDVAADYLATIADGPVWRPTPDDVRLVLTDQPLPEQPQSFDELLAFAEAYVLPHPFGNGHPRFFAWGNPPPEPAGVLADLLAATMNPSCAGGDHAAIHLERAVVRWLAELVGFPGDGVLVSGGATAALTALAAARHRAGERAALVYASAETHSCQHKAARLMGLGDDAVRTVPVRADTTMDVEALAEAIRRDRDAAVRPFAVVANAGVVNTGAVDDLDAIATICEREGLWLHVDGSLGAFGILDPRRERLFRGLDRADSVALDPHKWLGVPIDCAAVLVRRLDDLRDAFSLVPPYLRAEAGETWFSEYAFDQTRPFRALRLWATIASAGVKGLRERIARNVDHASRLAQQVRQSADFELCVEPVLNVVAFRHRSLDDGQHRELAWRIRTEADVFLTGTSVADREALRACFMHPGTTDDDVDAIVPALLRLVPA